MIAVRTLRWLLLGMGAVGLWAQQRPYPVRIGARVGAASQAEVRQRLNAAFPEGAAHPPGVNNCAELLASESKALSPRGTGPDAQAQRSTRAECLALRELSDAAPARVSYVADLKWDRRVMPLLPPELAINVSNEAIAAAKAAGARGQGWAEVDPTATAADNGPDQIQVKGTGFSERLILWGRGDFDRQGRQSLLVETLDTLTEGTYRSVRLFVLGRKTPNGPLRVVKQLL